MKTSDSIKDFTPDFIKALGEMENVDKTGTNPHFKSDYSTIAAVLEVTRAPLAKFNLGLTQFCEEENKIPVVITRIFHSSGEWIETRCSVGALTNTPQEYGSTITYLRRYSIMAICGIGPKDDDGNAASLDEDKDKLKAKTFVSQKQEQKKSPSVTPPAGGSTVEPRLNNLPDDVKELFRAKKYTQKAVEGFCNTFRWNIDKIREVLKSNMPKEPGSVVPVKAPEQSDEAQPLSTEEGAVLDFEDVIESSMASQLDYIQKQVQTSKILGEKAKAELVEKITKRRARLFGVPSGKN